MILAGQWQRARKAQKMFRELAGKGHLKETEEKANSEVVSGMKSVRISPNCVFFYYESRELFGAVPQNLIICLKT
jgi:hypothetical protein